MYVLLWYEFVALRLATVARCLVKNLINSPKRLENLGFLALWAIVSLTCFISFFYEGETCMNMSMRIKGLLYALLGILLVAPYFFGRSVKTRYLVIGFGVYCVIAGVRMFFLKKPQQACCDHNTCGCDRGRVAYPR